MIPLIENYVHQWGAFFGLLLLFLGVRERLPAYMVAGFLWFLTNATFLWGGEGVFNSYVPYNSLLFVTLFMIIPAYVMGLTVFTETYAYNHWLLRLLVLLVIIVDSYHLGRVYPWLLLTILLLWVLVRHFRPVHYDDVHPDIPLQREYLDRADILFVIPKYHGDAITNHPEYVQRLKDYAQQYGKKLALHGVTHEPEGYFTTAEFGIPRGREYLQEGIDIFTKAFGYRPTLFKAPCYNLHPQNAQLLTEMGLEISGAETLLFNRLFHVDNGLAMTLFNRLNLFI